MLELGGRWLGRPRCAGSQKSELIGSAGVGEYSFQLVRRSGRSPAGAVLLQESWVPAGACAGRRRSRPSSRRVAVVEVAGDVAAEGGARILGWPDNELPARKRAVCRGLMELVRLQGLNRGVVARQHPCF